MPTGVLSAILFATLIGGALLALLPSLINRAGTVVDMDIEDEQPDSSLPERERRRTSRRSKGGPRMERRPEPVEEPEHKRRAKEFVDKLCRSTAVHPDLRREIVVWLSTPARRRDEPSEQIIRVFASADKEPYQHKDAWLVRAVPRPRPRLIKGGAADSVGSVGSASRRPDSYDLGYQHRRAA